MSSINASLCTSCIGTGQCLWCEGSGVLINGNMQPCLRCNIPGEMSTNQPGDGLCNICKGTGSPPPG